jgi:hypothetical protein
MFLSLSVFLKKSLTANILKKRIAQVVKKYILVFLFSGLPLVSPGTGLHQKKTEKEKTKLEKSDINFMSPL